MRNHLTFLINHPLKKQKQTLVLKLLATIQTVTATLYLNSPVVTSEHTLKRLCVRNV